MASRHARYVRAVSPSDVLLNAGRRDPLPELGPMLQAEEDYVQERRRSAWVVRKHPESVAALAISGGGIRSATFSLGVLQALAEQDQLRQFDYLSTVSGGGYIGSSLVWWLSGRAGTQRPFGVAAANFPYGVDPPHPRRPPRDSDDQRAVLRYLRQRGEYITPGGGITLSSGVAAVLRGIVLNLSILAAFLIALLAFGEAGVELTLGRMDWVTRFYVDVMTRLSDLLTLASVGGTPPNLGPTPVLYQLLITLMLIPAALFVAFSFTYALYSRIRADGKENYPLRRWSESWAGRCLSGAVAMFLIGTLPFFYFQAGPLVSFLFSAVGGAAGLAAAVSRFLGGNKGRPSLLTGDWAVKIAAALLLYAVLLTAYGATRALFPAPGVNGTRYAWLAGAAGLAIVFSMVVNINHVSLHRFYRDRLMEAFLPDWATVQRCRSQTVRGADGTDLVDLNTPGRQAGTPLHLINCNAVLVDSGNLTWRERGGDSFVLTPLYCGSAATGWRHTAEFMSGRMSLATALAVSGAAANPNAVGVTRSRLVALLMSIVNLRLGMWVPHPRAGVPQWARPNHVLPGLSQVLPAGRWGYQEHALFVHLSDGGHFENLALYELIRRKARLIVLCDGAADPKYRFEDYQRMSRRVAIDFGATLDIAGTESLKALCSNPELPFPWPKKLCAARAGWVQGTIRYADGTEGLLIYVKATLIDGLPPEVLGYAKSNDGFPNQTTADQFFDEEQFEAYRQLGYHLGSRMIEEAGLQARLAAL